MKALWLKISAAALVLIPLILETLGLFSLLDPICGWLNFTPNRCSSRALLQLTATHGSFWAPLIAVLACYLFYRGERAARDKWAGEHVPDAVRQFRVDFDAMAKSHQERFENAVRGATQNFYGAGETYMTRTGDMLNNHQQAMDLRVDATAQEIQNVATQIQDLQYYMWMLVLGRPLPVPNGELGPQPPS